MKQFISLVILAAVALGGLLILALPGWMMYAGWGGGYGDMHSVGMMGGMMYGSPGGMWLGMWLGWATQFLLLALLVIGIGSVVLLKIK